MKTLTGRQNPTIVRAASLREKKYRERERCFLTDGKKLLCEALRAGFVPDEIFVTSACADFCAEIADDSRLTLVTDPIMEKLSDERSPEGVVGVFGYCDRLHRFGYDAHGGFPEGRYMLLSSLRDPGNLGTVARCAVAFGITGLILSADSADIYNPRCLRGSMGALFSLPVYECGDLTDAVAALRKRGSKVYAAALCDGARSLQSIKPGHNTCFIVGNEGHGIPPELISATDGAVIIPMEPGVQSLNAAVASAILMWSGYSPDNP